MINMCVFLCVDECFVRVRTFVYVYAGVLFVYACLYLPALLFCVCVLVCLVWLCELRCMDLCVCDC